MPDSLMFQMTEARPTEVRGKAGSSILTADRVDALAPIGGLFRGGIRQLCFDHRGSLLVLSGRGVCRLDPETLTELDRWLGDRHVQAVHVCGERLWVVTGDRIYLAAFGEELGSELASVKHDARHEYAAAGTKLAVVMPLGAMVVDASTGQAREYPFNAEWYEGLWSKGAPTRAMLSPSGCYVGVSVNFGSYSVVWECESGVEVLARDHCASTAILDDHRLIKGEGERSSVYDFKEGEWVDAPPSLHFEGAFVRGDRLLAACSNGGFDLFSIDTFAQLAHLDAKKKRYGQCAEEAVAAFSDAYVATYAAMVGILRVTAIGGATVESEDWNGAVEGFSVSQDGGRCSAFRTWADGYLDCVDLVAKTLVRVRGPSGDDITTAGITADGHKVVAPCGSILRARTVRVSAFGEAASTEVHKIKSCAHEFVNYDDELYAISTYTLDGSGHVGLHRAGVKRALAKVVHNKEQPWKIAVGHDDDELLVSWRSETVLYDMTKRPKASATFDYRADAVALGPRGFVACVDSRRLLITTPAAGDVELELAQRTGHEAIRLAFSSTGELLFVGCSDGVLEVRRSVDGALLRELGLHAGGFVALLRCGEAVWSMGKDGVVHIVGVADEAP